MKHLNKVIVLPLLIGILLSCEQKNEIKPDRLSELTTQVVSSIQFTSLKIKLSDLNFADAKYVDVSRSSIMIPFAGRDDRKGVVAIFDSSDLIKGVIEFEALTNADPDHIYTELKNGTFNGTFNYRVGVGKMSFQLQNSKVISSSMARMDGSQTAFKCRDMDETGGALDCAGARLENMSWYEQTACFMSFAICMANLVIRCLTDGCTVQYV
jgi:hypothetical protein